MNDPLRTIELKERLRLSAGDVSPDVQRIRDQEAANRRERFLDAQDARVLADGVYLQEVAQINGHEDGRYLTQVLDRLADEVRVLLVRGSTRELAMCLTKLQEAEHWAMEDGKKKGSHIVIDKRIFKVNHLEDAQ